MGSSIEPALDGIWRYLTTTDGLRPDDGVTVRSGAIAPEEYSSSQDYIIFGGNVTISETQAGMAGRAETPTVNGFIIVLHSGSDETAISAARGRVAELLDLVRAAVATDQSMGGAIGPPGGLALTGGDLQQDPVDLSGVACRRAQRSFSLSWTSHS